MVSKLNPALVEKAVRPSAVMSRAGLMERVFAYWFDSFVYNQIWEDPKVDMEALELTSSSRIVTIASGGCNVVNYLVKSPESIVALDINQYHIYLTRLKLSALRNLPQHSDFFSFFGCANNALNLRNYQQYIGVNLDEASRAFWEGGSWLHRQVLGPRINYFAKNFYDYAKLGYLLRFVHRLAKIVRRDPSRILAARNMAEQEQVFNETIAPFFDNKLVRMCGKNPLIMFSLGIPPRQYEAMKKEMSGDVIELYRERVKRLTCGFPIGDNYFAWQALSRSYDQEGRRAIPEYLMEHNYGTIKAAEPRVTTEVAPLTGYLKAQAKGSHDRFVLLDSQDWMQPEQIEELWGEIARVGRPGTRIIFRTGASESPVETALSPKLRTRFVYHKLLSQKLFKQDRAAIYGGFHVYVKPGE